MVARSQLAKWELPDTTDFLAWQTMILEASAEFSDLATTIECCKNSLASDVSDRLHNQSLMMATILKDFDLPQPVNHFALIWPFFMAGFTSGADKAATLDDFDAYLKQISLPHKTTGWQKRAERLLKINALHQMPDQSKASQDKAQIEKLREMLVAMVDDIQVVLIALAYQLVLLRHAKQYDENTQRQIAQDVMHFYAPLANRLGIWHLKWELEDLAFRYLQPVQYKRIAKALDARRVEREAYIESVIDSLKTILASVNVTANVSGRVKHIYSIFRKMQRKDLDFEEIYDVRAVRILVNDVPDCYAVLGLVHNKWPHIPKEFDDYIASPKENGYRSLHTAVIGPNGQSLEIQIRTQQMHDEAELGVAAHWGYKEGKAVSGAFYEQKINWLRELLAWEADVASEQHLLDDFESQIKSGRIYVFTKSGEVVDLPTGSTPIDFAYHVHTNVGHRCIGAKVGGIIHPLDKPLKTGDQVTILVGKTDNPRRDWLIKEAGFIQSARARSKIQAYFRKLDRAENTQTGKQLFEKSLSRLQLKIDDADAFLASLNLKHIDDLYAQLGTGDISIEQALKNLEPITAPTEADAVESALSESEKRRANRPFAKSNTGIIVEGVPDLLTECARCCHPLPGEPIRGFITSQHIIRIHRTDCPVLIDNLTQKPERELAAYWANETAEQLFEVDLRLIALEKKGLLKAILDVLATYKVNVTNLQTALDKSTDRANIELSVEVHSYAALSQLIIGLQGLPEVVEVVRV